MRPALAACLVTLSACATVRSPEQVDGLLAQAMEAARVHLAEGQEPEAYQFVSSVQRIAPTTAGLLDLQERIASEHTRLFDRPFLGSNLSLRPEDDKPWWARALLYVPDRVLDVLDVVSFDVHFGFGAYGNVHVTRGLQAGAGFRTVGGFGWHEHRSLGIQGQTEAGLAVVGMGTQVYSGSVMGSSGVVSGSDSMAGLHRPSGVLYRDFRDYWAMGAGVTAGVVGVDVDLHPLQIVDAVLGVFTLDFLHDDFAATRGLKLTKADIGLLEDLGEVERSEETLEAWRGRGVPQG